MVDLLDWNEKVVFKKNKTINSIKHTLYKGVDELFIIKYILSKKKGFGQNVNIMINPENKAISFPKKVNMKSETSIFKLSINTNKLPDKWAGELLFEYEGLVNKVPLEFEKIKSVH